MKTVRISYQANPNYNRPFQIKRYCPNEAFKHGDVLDTYETFADAETKAKSLGIYRPELNTLHGYK